MKKFLIKGLVLVIILSLPQLGVSMAYFSDTETSVGNTFSAGCWGDPSVPNLIYPDNGYVAGRGSDWLNNSYMDWSDSWVCPGKTVTYQYESYHDEELTSLAYVSGMLSDSMIPAAGTPDGTYYWRVRAYNGESWSGWSDARLLIVDSSIPSVSPGSANSSIGDPATSPPETPEIVINEILPNPSGDDNAAKPAGEWVELYNRSEADINVDGWVLYDSDNTHELVISAANSDNNNNLTDSGETVVPVAGFLVVYRDGDGNFILNNDGDTVRLYDGEINSGGTLVDSHIYIGSVADDKSIARYPDGSDTWYDPIPTPGGSNKLETEGTLQESIGEEGSEELVETEETIIEDESVTEEVSEETETEIEELSSKEEMVELVGEDASEPQDPVDSEEVQGQDEEDVEQDENAQKQADEIDEQDVIIEQVQDETQGVSGDETVSDSESEDSQSQPEDLGQPNENDEIPTK